MPCVRDPWSRVRMSILPIVLACPPPDEVIWLYRLEEFAILSAVFLSGSLLLVACIAVGLHSARVRSR